MYITFNSTIQYDFHELITDVINEIVRFLNKLVDNNK